MCGIYSAKSFHLSSDSHFIEIIDIETGTSRGTGAVLVEVRQFVV